ncbi:glycosyl hydrolase family 18 protein [Lederbergia citri]|uniref:chitinase n=1 Tax=Lederbergia citri TaxID=2833580 RepID=A0A942YGK9_9BACI|nr:glycoside hydrolase family 18 protein [Lederbergia citri]MBS4195617.1 glycoside hydrolase family 18 protein [Lederbergia citri]
MKKHYLLLTIVAVLTFIGGFFLVSIFTSYITEKDQTQTQSQLIKGEGPKSEQHIKKENPQLEPVDSKVLIGYIQDFRDPASIDYTKLTHIIFSFVHPEKDGSLILNGEKALSNLRKIVQNAHQEDTLYLRKMVQNAHQEDTKVMIAVGGHGHMKGGRSYDYFKTAIANPTSRTKLIDELIELTNEENLDGIDIDFEHPRSKEDAHYLAVFTKTLGEKLHLNDKELSIAVYSMIHSVTGTEVQSVVYDPSMFHYVDRVNIMAYDGQWDGKYNAANLSPYPFTNKIVSYWSNLFDKLGISKKKLVLGVPLYAQPEDLTKMHLSYNAIINHDPTNAERDIVNLNGTTYHYNGETTMIKKTKLALANEFGGMMLWELGHDAEGTRSLTSAIFDVLIKRQEEESR